MKAFLMCLAVLLLIPGTAHSKVKANNLGKTAQTTASIAIDPEGFPHVAYQTAGYDLYHARLNGKKWQQEYVDESLFYENAMAIDSLGRIHIVCQAERISPEGASYPLMHAFFDGSSWHLATLPVSGWSPSIALDSNEHPHILLKTSSNYWYGAFDGTDWEFEDTGLPWSWYSVGFALDGSDVAHVSFSVNYSGFFYATNRTGAWETTQLSDGNAGATDLALDSSDLPQVAIAEEGALIYYRFDGESWQYEPIIDFNDAEPGVNSMIETHIALALDSRDRARIMAGLYMNYGERYGAAPVFVFDNGMGWNGLVVDKKSAGLYPDMALDEDGSAYVTYCGFLSGKGSVKTKWARISLPDLTGDWKEVELNGSAVSGTLEVTNLGLETSDKAKVALLVSDDDVLDETDTVIPLLLKLKKMKPDAAVSLAVDFTYSGPLSGKYLIAVIDPFLETPDSNMPDNIIPVMLGP
jgi:hypothetical protein